MDCLSVYLVWTLVAAQPRKPRKVQQKKWGCLDNRGHQIYTICFDPVLEKYQTGLWALHAHACVGQQTIRRAGCTDLNKPVLV